jgi:hypothetical protein
MPRGISLLFGDVFIQANAETNVKAKGRAKQKSNPRRNYLAALRHAQGAYLIISHISKFVS